MIYKVNKKKVFVLVIIVLFLVSGIGSILFSVKNNNLIIEKDNDFYLKLKNSFINTTLEYTGESYLLERGIINETFSIYFHDGFWYTMEKIGIYRYYANWTHDISWDSERILKDDSQPKSLFFSEFWYILGNETNTVYQFTNTSGETLESWEYTEISFSLEEDEDPVAIYFQNGFWYMLGSNNSAVYKYYSNWTYTDVFFDINEVLNPCDFQFVDGYWWVLSSDKIYKYDVNWVIKDIIYIVPEGNPLVCFFSLDGNSFWMIGTISSEVYEYELIGTEIESISINFTLFNQNYELLDNSSYSLYINGTEVDFGFVEINSSDILITVYDRFGVIVFNQVESFYLAYLLGNTEYNIISIIHTVQFRLFDQNDNQLDDSFYLLYINDIEKDFGFVELNSITTNVVVYDRFNAVIFDGTGSLIGKVNFKIEIEVYRFRIKH